MAEQGDELSIKDFSKIVGIKQTVLRYYDEIGLFRPAGRAENNYRSYTLNQIQVIKLIETLRGLKVPLKQIKDLIDERDPEQMLRLLSHQEARLNRELKELQKSFTLIHSLRLLLQSVIPEDISKMEIHYRESEQLSLGPINEFREEEDYHRVYSEFYRLASEQKMNISYPIGGYFDTFEEFLATPSQPKRYFLLDPDGKDKTKSGFYLVAYHRGNYGEMGDLPDRIQTYAGEHKIELAGPMYQVYPVSELYTKEPNDYLLRTSVMIKR
jgi:DNA-binding transcriptional MerR regulator